MSIWTPVVALAVFCGEPEADALYPWLAGQDANVPRARSRPPADPRLWKSGPYCGLNCVCGVLLLQNRSVSHSELIKRHRPDPTKGFNMLELKQMLAAYGALYEVLEVPVEKLGQVEAPFIARLDGDDFKGHFVVVCAFDASQGVYRLLDGGACELSDMNASRFHRLYSGAVLAPTGQGRWAERLLVAVIAAELLVVVGLTAARFVRNQRRSIAAPASAES